MFRYENELLDEISSMKEKIEELIQEHRLISQEIFEELDELSKINNNKLSNEDINILKDKLSLLVQEFSIRNSFISDLENLIV